MNDKMNDASILIVDDNSKNLQVLGKMLSESGFQVAIAENGEQALNSVQANIPDLILLDVMMPVMDGYETCKQLKSYRLTRDIPIIFLTAKTETDEVIKGFEVGAVDYVTKPFNSKELLTRVNTHLQLKFSKKMVIDQRNELNEMLHILTHDLTNPLGGILNTLQIAQSKPDFLIDTKEILLSLAIQQSEVIDLVRELRAISEGKMKLSLAKVNVQDAFQKSLDTLEYQSSQKGIHFTTKIDKGINIIAERRSLISSVFNNLLTNAIKFSYPDTTIETNVHQTDDQIQMTIKDSGIGIPENLLKKMFMVDSTTTRFGTNGEKGTGFGMPLVKKFMIAYGGSIEITSKDESTFPDEHGAEIQLSFQSA